MSTLEEAIALAALAHEGQKDRGGGPYILHPLRVMLRVETPEQRMAAVLHDVVEDCDVRLEDLAQRGFPAEVVTAVDALSRREGEDYQDFVRRAARDPIGREVKRADLLDNLDPSRLAQLSPEKRAELESRYLEALALVEAAR